MHTPKKLALFVVASAVFPALMSDRWIRTMLSLCPEKVLRYDVLKFQCLLLRALIECSGVFNEIVNAHMVRWNRIFRKTAYRRIKVNGLGLHDGSNLVAQAPVAVEERLARKRLDAVVELYELF